MRQHVVNGTAADLTFCAFNHAVMEVDDLIRDGDYSRDGVDIRLYVGKKRFDVALKLCTLIGYVTPEISDSLGCSWVLVAVKNVPTEERVVVVYTNWGC